MEVAMAQGRKTVPDPTGGKRCSACRMVKPPVAFWTDRKAADGRQSQCKACRTARSVQFRKTRQYLDWLKAHRARPEVAARIKASRDRSLEKRMAYQKRYRRSPRGKVTEARARALRQLATLLERVETTKAYIAACEAELARMDRARDKDKITDREPRKRV
jgi:hypothetical protein